jgi:regulator of sigma E protease
MAGLIIALGLVLLIVAHELGHFFAAKLFKLHVHEFGIGFPPRLKSWKRGETEYSVNALPLGGFVRIAGEEDETETVIPKEKLLSTQHPLKRALVIIAGVAINAGLAWILLTSVFLVGTPHVVVLSEVEEGSPAAQAGLIAGDIVNQYASAEAFATAARDHVGRTFSFEVLRGSETVVVTTVPRVPTETHPGSLGVALTEGGIDRAPVRRAPYEALRATWDLTVATVQGFWNLLQRLVTGSVPGDVVGPVGIVTTASQVGGIGWIYLVQMLAVISINLAVLNLLPIPALDGGKLYLTLIEWISGKKLPKWIEVRLNAFTFLALIALMLLLTARDILRLF